MLYRRQNRIGKRLMWLLFVLLALIILLPIVRTFMYSFFSPSEMKAYLDTRGSYDEEAWIEVKLSPEPFSLRQYYRILIEDSKILQLFVNSAFYAVMIIVGQALSIPLLAYGLSRFQFKGRDTLFFCIIMLMLLPFQVTMAPNVIMLRRMNLIDTPWAVILPMWFSPFFIFLLRQFMVTLPNELIEAGMIDGAGEIRCFVHIVLPVCRPVLGAAVALSFAECWNLVEQPLIYLSNNPEWQPLSVMFQEIGISGQEIAFAGAALYILPALFVYMFFQEDIVLGIQLSELK